jgi:hypothetical protein
MKNIIKSPNFILLIAVILLIALFSTNNTEVETVEEVKQIETPKEVKEVAKVISSPLKEVHKVIVKKNDVKEDKEYQRLINKLFNEDDALYKRGYKKSDIDIVIVNERIAYYKRKISEMEVDKYIQYKKDYEVLFEDYKILKRLKNFYDREYRAYRKQGKSRTWIYKTFNERILSPFEKKFVKFHKGVLSYHDVNALTKYHFKDTSGSKLNPVGFLERIRKKRDNKKLFVDVYEINKKSFDKILSLYGKLKKKMNVGSNHDGI